MHYIKYDYRIICFNNILLGDIFVIMNKNEGKLEMGWRIRCYDIYILTGKNGERREKKKVEQFAECYMNKRLEL